MPSTIIVGSQWGDEGKGKIVDLLARNVDIVARYQGGLMLDIQSNSRTNSSFYTLYLQEYFIQM